MAIIKNYNRWKRTNKVLLMLTIVFLLLAPISAYQFMEMRKHYEAKGFAYRLSTDTESDNIYDVKAELIGFLKVGTPVASVITSGIFGLILWCRKPNDNLEKG